MFTLCNASPAPVAAELSSALGALPESCRMPLPSACPIMDATVAALWHLGAMREVPMRVHLVHGPVLRMAGRHVAAVLTEPDEAALRKLSESLKNTLEALIKEGATHPCAALFSIAVLCDLRPSCGLAPLN